MKIDRMGAVLGLVLAAAIAIAGVTQAAEQYSIWNAAKRTQVSVNVGGVVFFEEETGGEGWKGASGGGALTYSLHERFAIFGLYDHGFPIDADRAHENVLRASSNLLVVPLPGETSAIRLQIGGGVARFDQGLTDGWTGYEGHVTVSRILRDGWAASLSYLYGVPFDDLRPKVNMAKVALGHRLFGAKY